MNPDPQKIEAFMGKMIGHMTGGMVCYSIWLGDELGIYREMAGAGPLKADAIAERTRCMLYTASASICTPNSLAQEVGLGLGAQAGEAKLKSVFEQAGFKHFRRASETPMNLILEARVE